MKPNRRVRSSILRKKSIGIYGQLRASVAWNETRTVMGRIPAAHVSRRKFITIQPFLQQALKQCPDVRIKAKGSIAWLISYRPPPSCGCNPRRWSLPGLFRYPERPRSQSRLLVSISNQKRLDQNQSHTPVHDFRIAIQYSSIFPWSSRVSRFQYRCESRWSISSSISPYNEVELSMDTLQSDNDRQHQLEISTYLDRN